MDIKHITITFQDQFSGAKLVKHHTASTDTFEKMKNSIGSVVHRFENNIHWQWEVIGVEQFVQTNPELIHHD